MNITRKQAVVTAVSSLIILVLVATAAYFYGYENGAQNPEIIIHKGIANLENPSESVDFQLFWDAWQILKENFVDSDKLSDQDLLYGAIKGIFGATKDPYTLFLPPAEAEKFNEDISGEFGGVGIEIGLRQEQLIIIAPLKGTPGEKAGLKSGDYIIEIDGQSTAGITTDEAVSKIRGEKGTKITLTILREQEDPKKFEIIRDRIQVPTLDWKMINLEGKDDQKGGIVYVHLYNFFEKSSLLFYETMVKSLFYSPKGIVIDLRDNPGGYLESSVNIAGWFMERGQVVVKEKFRDGEIQELKARGTGIFKDTPVVILINEGSASASEILAGAMRDNRETKLVGKTSFGKGSVQTLEELSGGSVIKVTIAKWLTPKDHVIEKNGLKPDVEVEQSDNKDEDEQLKKALELLKEQIRK